MTLRVRVYQSCCSTTNCIACEDASLGPDAREACYARGCCCFGATVHDAASCSGAAREEKRANYTCPAMGEAFVLPGSALVGFSVFDLDSGTTGEYREQVRPTPSDLSQDAPTPPLPSDALERVCAEQV